MKIALVAIVVLLPAACGNQKQESPAKAEPGAGPSCQVRAAELREWMGKLVKEGGHRWPAIEPSPSAQLVVTSAAIAGTVPDSAIVTLTPEEVSVDGTVVGSNEVDREKLQAFLGALKASAGKTGPAGTTLGLAVDGKTSWSKVVDAVAASSQAGYASVCFLFSGPAPERTLSPPPASSLSAEITAVRKEIEAVTGGAPVSGDRQRPDLLAKTATNCPPLREVFETAARVEPEKRTSQLTDSVVAAIEKCECKADIPALEELYYYLLFGGPERTGVLKGAVVMPVLPDVAGASMVAAPAASTWQEVHSKLLDVAAAGGPPKVVLKTE